MSETGYRNNNDASDREYPRYFNNGTGFSSRAIDKILGILRRDINKAFQYADKNSNIVPGRTYTKRERAYTAEQKRIKHIKNKQKRSKQRKNEGKSYNFNDNETLGFEDPTSPQI